MTTSPSTTHGGAIADTVGVLVIRHGITPWNETNRWQGWADIPLSPAGEEQAQHAAGRLVALGLRGREVRVVTSDLERARQTAHTLALAIDALPLHEEPQLRERHVGEWSGLTTPEVEARWPGMLTAWRDGELRRPPGGEDEDEFRARIGAALVALCEDAHREGRPIIAVAHGGVIRTLERMHGVEPAPVANVSGRWFHWSDSTVRAGGFVDLLEGDRAKRPSGTAL